MKDSYIINWETNLASIETDLEDEGIDSLLGNDFKGTKEGPFTQNEALAILKKRGYSYATWDFYFIRIR